MQANEVERSSRLSKKAAVALNEETQVQFCKKGMGDVTRHESEGRGRTSGDLGEVRDSQTQSTSPRRMYVTFRLYGLRCDVAERARRGRGRGRPENVMHGEKERKEKRGGLTAGRAGMGDARAGYYSLFYFSQVGQRGHGQ